MDFINPTPKNFVYLITCPKFNLQYVGSATNMLKIRIHRHLSDAKLTLSTNMSTVSKHFHICSIEKVLKPPRGGDHQTRLFDHKSLLDILFKNHMRHDLTYHY